MAYLGSVVVIMIKSPLLRFLVIETAELCVASLATKAFKNINILKKTKEYRAGLSTMVGRIGQRVRKHKKQHIQ